MVKSPDNLKLSFFCFLGGAAETCHFDFFYGYKVVFFLGEKSVSFFIVEWLNDAILFFEVNASLLAFEEIFHECEVILVDDWIDALRFW